MLRRKNGEHQNAIVIIITHTFLQLKKRLALASTGLVGKSANGARQTFGSSNEEGIRMEMAELEAEIEAYGVNRLKCFVVKEPKEDKMFELFDWGAGARAQNASTKLPTCWTALCE